MNSMQLIIFGRQPQEEFSEQYDIAIYTVMGIENKNMRLQFDVT